MNSAAVVGFPQLLLYLDGSQFNQNLVIPYRPQRRVESRNDFLVALCRGKRVLHIGCCDHAPLIQDKIGRHEWLHSALTECSEYTIGIDIDRKAVESATEISELDNIYVGDVTSDGLLEQICDRQFDIALFGEVVEHISNPVSFLERFRQNYSRNFQEIVITVPNAFRAGNIIGTVKNTETINTDHRFFFTPYTISKVAVDAGFLPKDVTMATFLKAGCLKTMVLNRFPLMAEDIIFTGWQR